MRKWRDSSVYSDKERLILEYTEALVKDIRISDDLYKRVAEIFTPKQIIDICFTSGISGIINRIHGTFQTEVDELTLNHKFVKESQDALKKNSNL
ncbi:carboxymuconolactone decarboxylase family protein [Neobacillus terrae]|uniref:carboxymuconolactone decarboxylase family protein n=1 Tax=Neobacillus terrae TaxID=3034837 RepID=UPI00140ADDA3|nr:carboxymuconolactone decarboxylase family protein [Neobacillus terrae]NHM33699.1 carboxymuconolactone decarboxylase family protein [Neobacillus terrae]